MIITSQNTILEKNHLNLEIISMIIEMIRTIQRNKKNDERKYKTNPGMISNERRHDSSEYNYSKKQKMMKENTKHIKE